MPDHRTWVEINTPALRRNIIFLQKRAGKTPLMAVVKSNAYGHGMDLCATCIEACGVRHFGVFEYEEAIRLRKNKIKSDILILGYTPPMAYEDCARKNIAVTISNFESLQQIVKLSVKDFPCIHIKVDTGLGRQGFLSSDMNAVLAMIKNLDVDKQKKITGLYSHFAVAEDKGGEVYTRKQIRVLQAWKTVMHQNRLPVIVHASASSGIFLGPDFHFDMVRAGIALYGIWPSFDIEKRSQSRKLTPILTWKTRISEIKKLPKGARVSYGLTETLARDSLLAVLPIGYWDGFDRKFSKIGKVVIKGRYARIVGRVCMNMCIVDVTDIATTKAGDEVVIIGGKGIKRISAEESADMIGTINYEFVTRINPQIARIAVD